VVHQSGSPIDPSVVAVPCLKLNGVFISQTMAIMEALGDHCQYNVPAKASDKARQTMLNIYDIQMESVEKRGSIKTKDEALKFVNTRVKQFFEAIEAGYKNFEGPLFYGSHPSFVDFQLLGATIQIRFVFGHVFDSMISQFAPTVAAAASIMAERPRIAEFISGKYAGEPVFPPSLDHNDLIESFATENKLYYWPIKARNVLPILTAKMGGVELTQVVADW